MPRLVPKPAEPATANIDVDNLQKSYLQEIKERKRQKLLSQKPVEQHDPMEELEHGPIEELEEGEIIQEEEASETVTTKHARYGRATRLRAAEYIHELMSKTWVELQVFLMDKDFMKGTHKVEGESKHNLYSRIYHRYPGYRQAVRRKAEVDAKNGHPVPIWATTLAAKTRMTLNKKALKVQQPEIKGRIYKRRAQLRKERRLMKSKEEGEKKEAATSMVSASMGRVEVKDEPRKTEDGPE